MLNVSEKWLEEKVTKQCKSIINQQTKGTKSTRKQF